MTELLPELGGDAAATPVGMVPCVYCREPIAADTFAYWSSARRLLSAACPTCERRVTLTAVTWRRWRRGAVAATEIADAR